MGIGIFDKQPQAIVDDIAEDNCPTAAAAADDFNKAINEADTGTAESGSALFGSPQDKPTGGGGGSADGGAVAAKKTVSNATRLATHTDAQLRQLAKWPEQAHAEWNKLTQLERIVVFDNMSKLYGGDFAKKFLEFTKSGSRQDAAYYGPHFPEHTPQWFAERGFTLAQRDSVHDWWWVHPFTANRDTSPWKPGTRRARRRHLRRSASLATRRS